MVKKVPPGCRERPRHQGLAGMPRFPVGLGGEPSEETCAAQPGQVGAGQPAQVCHRVALVFFEFHLLIPEVAFREVPEMGVFLG